MKRFIAVLVGIIMLLPVTLVYAKDSVNSVTSVITGSAAISQICSQANNTVEGKKILTYDARGGSLSFDNSLYSKLDTDDKHTFMETALLATKKSGLGKQQKNKVYNFIADQDSTVSAAIKYLKDDTSADFVSAKAWFRPFSNPISTLMGFLCIVIFMFMGMGVLFDVAYLVLPGFQLLVEHGEPNKRPFGVSNEAWKTNREIQDANNKDNVMSVYMKRKFPVLLLIAICLGYLVSGKIYDLLVYFIDAFSNM